MQLLNQLSELSEHTVLAIGTFDGFHIGHQAVLTRAKELAKENGIPFAVMTFMEHPMEYLCPEKAPKHLLNFKQKRRFCYDFGVDELLEIEFNRRFAEMTASDFAEKVSPHLIVVGKDFTFGNQRTRELGDFKSLELCPLFEFDGATVSSTRVRWEISNGNLELVRQLLGRDYSIQGTVQHGDERGQILGFPTANLDFGKYCIPGFGAYIGKVQYHDRIYPAMINVGNNPTFLTKTVKIEAHLIGFEGDLYEQEIQIDFLKKLREEKKFYNVKELSRQLEEDKNNTCAYFQDVIL